MKNIWGLQRHHIIPREWRDHPTIIKFSYDVNAKENLIFMPSRITKRVMRIDYMRPIHDHGHPKYNKYVKKNLDCIESMADLYKFRDFLKKNCRRNEDNIPWY